MRPLPLLALALAVSGCGAFDCPSIGEYRTVEGFQRLQSRPEVSDTLTVVFEPEATGSVYAFLQNVWIGLDADTPRVSERSDVELAIEIEFSAYDVERPPPLRASAASDTVTVSLGDVLASVRRPACAEADGVIQPVCSYAEPTYTLFVGAVSAPEGVRHVRFRIRGYDGEIYSLAPSATPPVSSLHV